MPPRDPEPITDGELLRYEAAKPDAADEVLGDIDDQVRADLEHALNELGASGDDVKVQLKFYQVAQNGAQGWLFDIFDPAADMDYMTKIRDEYGSGNYCCHIFVNSKLRKKPRFSVIAPRVADVVKSDNSGLERLMQYVLQSNEKSQQRFEAMMREQAAAQAQQSAGAAQTLEMLRTSKELFGGSKTDTGAVINNIVAVIGAVSPFLMPFVTKWAAGAKASEDPVASFEKMIGVADKLSGLMGGGGKSESGGAFGLIKEAFPMFMDVLRGQMQIDASKAQAPHPVTAQATRSPFAAVPQQPAQPQPQPQPRPRPQPTVTPSPEFQQPPTVDEMDEIKIGLMLLCSKAAANEPPENAALGVLEMIPDAKRDDFLDLIESPDAVDQLITRHGKVAEYRPWFESLRAAILAELDSGDEADDTLPHEPTDSATHGDTVRESGHAGDAAHHGESSESGSGDAARP